MSDADNEKNVTTEDDTEASFSRLPLVKTRSGRKNGAELRHPRQKFCARWEKDFPWLKADNLDESVGICTVCNKHLVCKKSHLERHQRSYKHQRLQGFEVTVTDGNAADFLECTKREPEDEEEFGHAIEVDPDYSADFEFKLSKRPKRELNSKLKNAASRKPPTSSATKPNPAQSQKPSGSGSKLDRFKLLKRIDRDRNELNEYYYARRRAISPTPQLPKDTFDLFFESVSASVKTLPPKLAAEVKGRVSQLVAEFELRAICEREALENSQAAAAASAPETATVMVASSTHDVTPTVTQESASIDPATGVPHIVYTFQPKLRE